MKTYAVSWAKKRKNTFHMPLQPMNTLDVWSQRSCRIQQKQVYGLICSKAFYDARFQIKWLVIVDGTQLYSGKRKLNGRCLERHYHKGTAEETVNYHYDVLGAKVILAEGLTVSIASGSVENNGEDAERQKNMGEEERKQDCETKAFKRLAEKVSLSAVANHTAGRQFVRTWSSDGDLSELSLGIYHPL